MRLIFAGTPEAALPSLQALINSDHEIVGVITRPDAPIGRGRTMSPSAVATAASEHGLHILKAKRVEDIAIALRELKPDLAVVVAYGSLIKEPLLSSWPWINLHFSLLPAFRGAAPVQHALLAGEEITGATTFLLDEGMDTGPVLGQITERVRGEDTAGSLLTRLSQTGADLLLATVNQWHEITPVPQTNDGASLAPKITTVMARIDWSKSAQMINRHVRAMFPAPGAWTLLGDQRIEILEIAISDQQLPFAQLESQKQSALVGTGSTAIELVTVKPQGKRAMAGADWARGLRQHDMRFS